MQQWVFHRHWASTLLLCAGIGGIYLVGILSRSIWYDEAITLQSLSGQRLAAQEFGFVDIGALKTFVTGTTSLPELIRRYIETDVHPPLYFILAHAATLIFGTQLVVVRGLSLVLVLFSALLYRRLLGQVGERTGLGVMLVYALSFAAITTAQDARGYALVLLLVILAWRLLILAARCGSGQGRFRIDFLLGLTCGGLLLTHYFALFVVLPLLGWRMIETTRNRDPAGLIAPLVCACVFAPWLPVMLEHLGARPEQMAGFQGVLPWSKRMMLLLPAQVISATHGGFPDILQNALRGVVLLLMLIGTLRIMLHPAPAPERRGLEHIAVFVPAAGLLCFLLVSILLDRWFDTFRYLLFFAPFLCYLAARGALLVGTVLASPFGRKAYVAASPLVILIAVQLAMANFGYETNRNRGGAYFKSIAHQLRSVGVRDSLVIIDPGNGRGTLLAAAQALPEENAAYVLPRDPAQWAESAERLAPQLAELKMVLLVFTITRGNMESDKTLLYDPIVQTLEAAGFIGAEEPPVPHGRRFYAKWERPDGNS
ncbi:glycosyltransferase family 39 protein [Sulfitobacter aestuarii]|uniref:Glycosyltransferase family 39 protein n=1 Tax=Sulfitobacter aestuarii TaxID=2161676 RepID=A0ABW5U2W6_9RHOB